MLCGANPPRVNFQPDAATKANFKLHFEITTNDGIWPSAYQQGTAAYEQLGMAVTKDNTKPGGHCQFSQPDVVLQYIGAMKSQ